MRNRTVAKVFLVIISLILFVHLANIAYYYIVNMFAEVEKPKRLDNIPSNAIWAGGIDGGAWFLCRKINYQKAYCRIYDDSSGEIWKNGYFEAIKGTLQNINFSNEKTYDFFDGENVYLNNETVILRFVK